MAIAARRARLRIAVVAAALAALMAPAAAQAPGPDSGRAGPQRATIAGGQTSAAPDFQRCIEVEIGGSRSFDCLNERLRRAVSRVHPAFNAPPLDARSSDIRVGTANSAAVQQQYGPNYGRSVIPWRPAPPPPVAPRR